MRIKAIPGKVDAGFTFGIASLRKTKTLFAAIALAFVAACNDGDVMGEIEKGVARDAAQAQQSVASSENFMATARAKPGVDVRPSGLVIEHIDTPHDRSLPPPPEGSTVLVHYEGALPNGTVFDSSIQRGEPAQFPLDGVIPGFSEAIKLMHPGDAVIAYIPADIGYGAQGSPPAIPPNSALQFRIQLLAYRTPDGRTVQARPE